MSLAVCLSLCALQSLPVDSFDPQVLPGFTTQCEYQSAQVRVIPLGDETLVSTVARHPVLFSTLLVDELEWKLERLSSSGQSLWTNQITLPPDSFIAEGWNLDESAGTITFVSSNLGAHLRTIDVNTGELVGDEIIPLAPPLDIAFSRFDPISQRLFLSGAQGESGRRVTAVSLVSKTQSWTYADFDAAATPFPSSRLYLSPDGGACYWLGETGPNIFLASLTFVKLDASTGAEVWTTLGPTTGSTWASALSPDGQRLGFAASVSGGPDYGQIDTSTGAIEWQLSTNEAGFSASPSLAYSSDSARMAVSFGQSSGGVGSFILEANAFDGSVAWTDKREDSQIAPVLASPAPRLLATDNGDWLWGYGSFDQSTLGFTIEHRQGMSGTELGSVAGAVPGQEATDLSQLVTLDSLDRVRVVFRYYDLLGIFGWPFMGVMQLDLNGSQTLWADLTQVNGKDRSFTRQLAEVGEGSAALMLVEGEGVALPGVEFDELLVCTELETGGELWSRSVRAQSFALSDDRSQVAVRGNDGALYLLDALTGAELLQVQPSPGGEVWTEHLAEGAGYEPVLIGPDFIAYQESHANAGELVVVDSASGQVRFSVSLGLGAGSPLALSGDRLYFVIEEGASRQIRWVSTTTGQVSGNSIPVAGADAFVRHLWVRDGHLLAGILGDLSRIDPDLTSLDPVQSLTAPLALYPLAPGLGVLVNSAGKASQVDVPQAGSAPLDLGWELDVEADSLLLTPADGGRVVIAPGSFQPGSVLTPPLKFAPKVYDAASGELLGESEPLFVGQLDFRASAESGAESNRFLVGSSVLLAPETGGVSTSMAASLVTADLPTLYRSQDQVSLSSPDAIDFYLRGPQASAGSGVHFLLAGLGLADPPTLVDGLEVPFTLADPITACVLLQCQPFTFQGFLGTWDTNGLSQARLNTPPGLEFLAGQTLDLAWLGFDSLAGPGLQMVSSTVSIELIP
ncbi:MAG: outer membrane protein assembly factor BamB family protein [Planctomycetota bacterium]|jgi:hypothetical protein